MPDPSPRHLLPDMELLLESSVRFDEQALGIIQDTGGDRAMEMDLDGIPPESNKEKKRKRLNRMAGHEEASHTADAMRKVPVTGNNARFYWTLLKGIEPCLPPVANTPGLTSLSLKISLRRNHDLLQERHRRFAFIESCHTSCLVLSVRIMDKPYSGFYLVYDTSGNSVAIVPPVIVGANRCRIGAAAALLCWGNASNTEVDYVLAELHLHCDTWKKLPTNKATLLTWQGSLGCGQLVNKWMEREVLLPLPTTAGIFSGVPIVYCSFIADMVFALGPTSLCWVDLARGILVYNHHHHSDDDDQQQGSLFHFIPLPEDCAMNTNDWARAPPPKDYRSMGCIQGAETLKFVSIEGYATDLPFSESILTTWTLIMHPLRRPNNWVWNKDEVSFCIGDLFDDPIYKDELKLPPLPPQFPLISTVKPGVIYLSVFDCEFDDELYTANVKQSYVLSLDMHSQRVVSAVKCPPDGQYPSVSQLMTFTYNSVSYLNKGGKRDGRGDLYEERPRENQGMTLPLETTMAEE